MSCSARLSVTVMLRFNRAIVLLLLLITKGEFISTNTFVFVSFWSLLMPLFGESEGMLSLLSDYKPFLQVEIQQSSSNFPVWPGETTQKRTIADINSG